MLREYHKGNRPLKEKQELEYCSTLPWTRAHMKHVDLTSFYDVNLKT